MEKRTLTFSLNNDLAHLQDLCARCGRFGQAMGLPEKLIFQMNLALDELFTNIVSYGFKDGKDHKIEISLAVEAGMLILRIEDDGMPFNPAGAQAPDLKCSLKEHKIGGLGIHLIRHLMDDIDYQRSNHKNILTLRKKIAGPA